MAEAARAADAARLARIQWEDEWLTLHWQDGRTTRHPAIWLRDNLPEGRQGLEGQRLFDVASLPEAVTLTDARLEADGGLALRFGPDGSEGRLSLAWLGRHCHSRQARAARHGRPRLWNRRQQDALPRADYRALVAGGEALRQWLAAVRDYGFALLSGVPRRSGEVCRVAEIFGFVRETNYGRFFDVVAREAPSNLAYSGLALGLHTDNPYRDPVPTLQLLHCLEASAEGGESLLADGFFAAERLRREAPEDFDLLARHWVPFRYRDASTILTARAPLIALDDRKEVNAIRYNNRSIAPLDLDPEILPQFYRAYRHFSRLLHDTEGLVSFRLSPGDLFIVNNCRVLHGRGGFGGRRHLQGCYADIDGLLSRLALLEQGR